MKNVLRSALFSLALLLTVGVAGYAQVSRPYVVHIPFDFTVGDKQYKQGDYRIAPLDGITNQRAVVLESRATANVSVLGQTSIDSSYSNKQGRITFAKISDQWILREVETPGFKLRVKSPAAEAELVATAGKPVETTSVTIGR
jgi:hypothetical protein